MDARLSESPLVSVILVTWNSAPCLRRCLEGIAGQIHPRLELIVIDNASDDDSVDIALQAAKVGGVPAPLQMIRNPDNRGFSAAVNQGIAVARGEFVQLVNPDAFLEPQYIARLVEAVEKAGPQFGMATGKLLQAEGPGISPIGRIDSRGIRMTRTGRHLDIDSGTPDHGKPAADREVFGVSGAAALYRISFLRDVAIDGEVFDEDFFAYREDADIAWRGRLFGWRALHEPDAIGYHVRRVTPEKRHALPPALNMHSVKNRFLLRLKNEGLHLALRNAPFEIARDLLVIAAAVSVERTSFPALVWLWRNRKRVLAKRRTIQNRRRVSDRQLAGWFR